MKTAGTKLALGPAKWEALEKQCGVKETLRLYIDPVMAAEKHALLNDILAVATSKTVEAIEVLLREKSLDAFVVVTTDGQHIFTPADFSEAK